MPVAPLTLVKQCIEWRNFDDEEVEKVPHRTRGIYVLFRQKQSEVYDVMYIGMTGKGIHGRLRSHLKSRTKAKLCTHFSVFEVHDNVSEEEIEELEGILRHIFRQDSHANQLAKQLGFGKLRKVRRRDWGEWKSSD